MKVLFTSHWYPSKDNPAEATFIKKHFTAVNQTGYEVELLLIRIKYGKHLLKSEINKIESGNEIIVYSIFWKFLYLLYPLQKLFVWKTVLNFVRKNNYNLIHSNISHPNAVFANYLSDQLNIPFIITEHHSQIEKYASKLFTKKAIKKAVSNAKSVTSVSNFLRIKLIDINNSIDVNKFHVVGNAINGSDFHYINSEININSFLSIGSWSNSKSNTKLPHLTCQSLSEIAFNTKEKIILKHIGKCSIKSELIENYEHEYFKIEFLGLKTSSQINLELNKAGSLIHTTRFETFCVVGVEAQKAGCPLIISNIAPINQILDHSSIHFSENTVQDLKKQISNVLKIRPFRAKIASDNSNLFNTSDISDKFKNIYLKILE